MKERIANSGMENRSAHNAHLAKQFQAKKRRQDGIFKTARERARTGKCMICMRVSKECRCDERSDWWKERRG